MNIKQYIAPGLMLVGAAALVMVPELALASTGTEPSSVTANTSDGIGKVVETITGQLANVKTLIVYVAYIAAFGFGFAGIVKFKAHRDNPTQVPLSAPIVLLVVGIMLASITRVIDAGGESVFGADATKTSV